MCFPCPSNALHLLLHYEQPMILPHAQPAFLDGMIILVSYLNLHQTCIDADAHSRSLFLARERVLDR